MRRILYLGSQTDNLPQHFVQRKLRTHYAANAVKESNL